MRRGNTNAWNSRKKNAGTDYDSITAIIQDVQESHVERYEFLRSHLVSLITLLTGPV